MREKKTDVLIVGGGLGGIAAALSALRMGCRVILTEETDWLGGQLTAQGVPPDENWWIETEGCTASYRQLREGIRNYYRRNYPLLAAARSDSRLNPGMGYVSLLCHEPRVGLAVLEELLAPYRVGLRLEVLLLHTATHVELDGDYIRAVTLHDHVTNDDVVIQAHFFLDATELGDLLPLANVEHVIGSESQDKTGEPHALPGPAQPLDQQSISWCFAMDFFPDQDHTIAKPRDYSFWRAYQPSFWPGRLLSWIYSEPITLVPRARPLFEGDSDSVNAPDLWHYRRIFYRKHYPDGMYPSDVTLVNWPQMDYWLGPVVGVTDDEKKHHLDGARQLSLSWLYWMQTEAPRPDGKAGYPGLRLRPDVLGTPNGLAKYAYIRESRRIQAAFTVLEQHLGVSARQGLMGAQVFADSVGVGSYRIDLHPSTGGRNYIDIPTWPFQIPLGALIPVRVENLLPACKNIGTTHITNGCFREHPIEWNIGEAAGALVSWCITNGGVPRRVWQTTRLLDDFRQFLHDKLGFQLNWSESARLTS